MAQGYEVVKQPRILIILDGSSSMLEPWDKGQIRFKAAQKIITTLIDSIYKVNKDVEFALRVYGHQYPSQQNNCYDTKLEVMFSKDNLAQMDLRLDALRPLGVTPISFSIRQAAEQDLTDPARNSYSVVLITDGGESCGGNLCDVVREILAKKITFKPYILSLVDYAPLRQQYDCLGEYLLVSQPADITPAVNKIVDGYRPMIALDNVARKILQTTPNIPVPSALKVDIPSFKITKETEEETPPPAPKPKPKLVEKAPETTAVIKTPPPTYDLSTRTNESIDRELPKDNLPKINFVTVLHKLPQRVKIPIAGVVKVAAYIPFKTEVVKDTIRIAEPVSKPFPKDALQQLSFVSISRILPQRIKMPRPGVVKVSPFKPFKTEAPDPQLANTQSPKPVTQTSSISKPVPKPQPQTVAAKPPVKADIPKPKEAKFKVEHEEAKETTFELYFTNGKGKFYQSSPQIILLDPKTNTEVTKFWREVDISGNPRPQKIPVGVYNIMVKGKNKVWRNVEIKENNKNKYSLIVNNASLSFAYEDDIERKIPVTEYSARVKKNFEPGPVSTQLCSQEVEYEPGNYHILINTNPVRHESQDLDFDTEVVIRIERPGYVLFTNTNNIGKATLYYELGDQYVKFDQLQITGDPSQQRKELQRGRYKVGYNKTPNMPYSQETIKSFIVRSKETTEINLD